MHTKAILVLGLLPDLLAARSVRYTRRGVECSYSSTPSSGDDCDSFAASWGITTANLKALNPGINCGNLDTSREYCVIGEVTNDPDPTTTTTTSKQPEPTDDGHSPTQEGIAKDCDKYHKIVSGDQCDKIESKYQISHSQFSKWNPAINEDCNNLLKDFYVCVHVPGAETNPPDDGHSPTQEGIAKDCDKYHKIVSGDQCDKIESTYQISHAQFSKWNPAINDDCTNLLLDFYVCVHVPGAETNPPDDGHSPTQDGIAKDCDKYHKVASGDQCGNIEDKYRITHEQFSKWNPAINSQCTNLLLDYYVCVHVPGAGTLPPDDGHSPHDDDIAKNCDKYHKVVSGDQCDKIENDNNITHDDFRKWNPSINNSCSNLKVGYYVCVHAPGAQNPGPQPQLPNTDKNCKRYHKVQSGQGCYDIDQKYGISFDQFRRWNPSVNSACSNLLAGYYVCVGV